MFQFPAFASNPYVFRVRYLIINAWKPEPPKPSARFASDQRPAEQISQAFKVGFPIRRSMDQSLFAAPHGLSQRITSFIACACQGIHQMPLYHLIVLIAYAHHLAEHSRRNAKRIRLPFTTRSIQQCHKRVRYNLLRWHAGAQQGHIIKTSFSR